ncbi:MAG TPA: glycine zipper 2TM domain-containing protein [Thioalkalivibrio sp.]|nr:glycine zipper 2TM domain-containing protein [Thioalkalivibrio sp.]
MSSPKFRGAALGLLAASIALTGCTTLDPYTREEKTSSATKGAIIGGVVGAIIGNVSARDQDRRDRNKRTLIAAGVGALAGGAVGAYMDRQEHELLQQMEGTGVSVIRDGDNIILNMPSNVTFDFDRSEVKPTFHETLRSVALVLKKYDKTLIEIAGHTDSVGSESYNQALSERRALSVARFLEGQNITPSRIDPIGFGELRPIATNATEEGRALNRRVELTLIPLTQ